MNEPKVTGYSILRAKGANLPQIADSPKIRAALENAFLFSAETRFGVAESDARSTPDLIFHTQLSGVKASCDRRSEMRVCCIAYVSSSSDFDIKT